MFHEYSRARPVLFCIVTESDSCTSPFYDYSVHFLVLLIHIHGEHLVVYRDGIVVSGTYIYGAYRFRCCTCRSRMCSSKKSTSKVRRLVVPVTAVGISAVFFTNVQVSEVAERHLVLIFIWTDVYDFVFQLAFLVLWTHIAFICAAFFFICAAFFFDVFITILVDLLSFVLIDAFSLFCHISQPRNVCSLLAWLLARCLATLYHSVSCIRQYGNASRVPLRCE